MAKFFRTRLCRGGERVVDYGRAKQKAAQNLPARSSVRREGVRIAALPIKTTTGLPMWWEGGIYPNCAKMKMGANPGNEAVFLGKYQAPIEISMTIGLSKSPQKH